MDQRWEHVLRSWLKYPEEIGAVISSPTHAEIWKGTATTCPYFKHYQTEEVIIVHSHPPQPDQRYHPPSPRDLLNCVASPNPHIVVAQEGFWIYSPTQVLRQEWAILTAKQKESLSNVILNNCHGLCASLTGGDMLDTFSEGIPRTTITIKQFQVQIENVIPRKDPSLPCLGFHTTLSSELPDRQCIRFEKHQSVLGHIWNVESLEDLEDRISSTKSGSCVSRDNSIIVV